MFKKISAAVVAVVSIVYIISPADFIPDILLPLGIVDDAGAAAALIWALRAIFKKKE